MTELQQAQLVDWYRRIDWRMLRRQKLRLYRLESEAKNTYDINALNGIAEAIDLLFDIKENKLMIPMMTNQLPTIDLTKPLRSDLTLKTTWTVQTYEVWGNVPKGYEVHKVVSGGTVELRIPLTVYNVGTPRESVGAHPTDRQIKRALGVSCRIAVTTDGLSIEVTQKSDGCPLGALQCISHESLSPVRAKEAE